MGIAMEETDGLKFPEPSGRSESGYSLTRSMKSRMVCFIVSGLG